uniref:SXP/RAL-2 family protein Ani s 5-like cation-binding domain-containing protein n=1 Tax=Panagrolaimus superbus TaxID=310955 RepID=A0A914YCX9_9BILA
MVQSFTIFLTRRNEINLFDQSLTEVQRKQFLAILSDSSLSEQQADDKIDGFINTLNDTQQGWYKIIKERQQLSIEAEKAFRLEKIAEMPQSLQKIANEIEKVYDDRNISQSDKKAKITEMKKLLPVEIRDELFPVYANAPIIFILIAALLARRG